MDINKGVFILKEKIQQDISEINLPVSVVKLILKDLMLEIQRAENAYFEMLAEKEKEENIQKDTNEDKE